VFNHVYRQLNKADIWCVGLKRYDAGDGKAEAWLITFTKALRHSSRKGQYILTPHVGIWYQVVFTHTADRVPH